MSFIEPALGRGQVIVESVMLDALVIMRNAGGVGDDVLDEAAGTLIRPEMHDQVVYGPDSTGAGGRPLMHPSGLGGIGKISPVEGTQVNEDTVNTKIHKNYRGSIPIDAPDIKPYDVVYVVAASRDQLLLDVVFYVREVLNSTFAVSRRLLLEQVTHAKR